MWGLIARAVTMVGVGFAAGGALANKSSAPQIPPAIMQESSSSIMPFIFVSLAILLAAVGYCAWSFRRKT